MKAIRKVSGDFQSVGHLKHRPHNYGGRPFIDFSVYETVVEKSILHTPEIKGEKYCNFLTYNSDHDYWYCWANI